MLRYSSNRKCESNIGFRTIVFKRRYSNCTVNIIEMSCESLNDKSAMKNILSDDL